MWQSGRVLSNPNASRGDKLLAGLNIGLGALLEAAEPDDALPVGVPLDDVGRRALMRALREAYEEGGEEAVERALRETLGDQADDILQQLGGLGDELADESLPRPLGRGSTGRTNPLNLTEKLAMEQAMSDPSAGRILENVTMKDSRWLSSEGWVKMSQYINGAEIHYVFNTITGAIDDFKFK